MKNKVTIRDLLRAYIDYNVDYLPPIIKYNGSYYYLYKNCVYKNIANAWKLFDDLTPDMLDNEVIVYQEGGLFDLVPTKNGNK